MRNVDDSPDGTLVVVCTKSALMSGTGSCRQIHMPFIQFPAPAATYDANLDTLYLTRDVNGFDGRISIDTITGAIGSEVYTQDNPIVVISRAKRLLAATS